MLIVSKTNPKETFIPLLTFLNITDEVVNPRHAWLFADNKRKILFVLTKKEDDPELLSLIKYRALNKLPFCIIYDESFEFSYNRTEVNNIVDFYKNLGTDVDNDFLFINCKDQLNTEPDFVDVPYILNCYSFAIDAFHWKKHTPEKFTSLELAKRPNLSNLIVSKIKQKYSRAALVYEFYKNNMLKDTLLSIMGTLGEFVNYYNDQEFLKEIEQRLENIGGVRYIYEEGHSNLEFGCQTSNKTLFNNARLSCVHETAWCSYDKQWMGNGFLTEKFHRAILNKTPFILFSYPGAYKRIVELGYDTFGSLIDLSFDEVENCDDKIRLYTEQVKQFLISNPENLNELQRICDKNYQTLMDIGEKEYTMYHSRLSTFLNGVE